MPRSCAKMLVLPTLCLLLAARSAAGADPEETVRSADQILREMVAIPARSIPESLLAEAQGVAIIPSVLKIGFIAGIRRGHGVVLVRDESGQWSLPQFVTLTGGSVGWQAGVQGTDVVLVFTTRKGVEGLLSGKFTIGADAAAAAGPVGRNAAAATDMRLKAEILSYSRSRGLFAGISLDGSAIEIDRDGQSAYYGTLPGQPPQRVPESAVRLRTDLVNLTAAPTQTVPPPVAVPTAAIEPDTRTAPARLAAMRESLATSASQLQDIVDEPWQKYLALPAEVFEGKEPPRADVLRAALRNYENVANNPRYKSLASRPEFSSTHELLRDYTRALGEPPGPQLALPPPPTR